MQTSISYFFTQLRAIVDLFFHSGFFNSQKTMIIFALFVLLGNIGANFALPRAGKVYEKFDTVSKILKTAFWCSFHKIQSILELMPDQCYRVHQCYRFFLILNTISD